MEIKNRRAGFEYFITDRFSAGIVLTGSEIKSIRDGKANITDGYCSFQGNELFLRNVHISEWKFAAIGDPSEDTFVAQTVVRIAQSYNNL